MLLHLRLSPHALKKFTDNADATDFIFSQILFLLVLPLDIGFTTDCICAYTALDYLQQEIIVTSFGWKPIPSEARVTRDEVSGIKKVRESCLEDSTPLMCSLAFGSLATFKINHG